MLRRWSMQRRVLVLTLAVLVVLALSAPLWLGYFGPDARRLRLSVWRPSHTHLTLCQENVYAPGTGHVAIAARHSGDPWPGPARSPGWQMTLQVERQPLVAGRVVDDHAQGLDRAGPRRRGGRDASRAPWCRPSSRRCGELIHATIEASYTGVYPPRAVQFFKDYQPPPIASWSALRRAGWSSSGARASWSARARSAANRMSWPSLLTRAASGTASGSGRDRRCRRASPARPVAARRPPGRLAAAAGAAMRAGATRPWRAASSTSATANASTTGPQRRASVTTTPCRSVSVPPRSPPMRLALGALRRRRPCRADRLRWRSSSSRQWLGGPRCAISRRRGGDDARRRARASGPLRGALSEAIGQIERHAVQTVAMAMDADRPGDRGSRATIVSGQAGLRRPSLGGSPLCCDRFGELDRPTCRRRR